MKKLTKVLCEEELFQLQKEIEYYENKGYSAIQSMQIQTVKDNGCFLGSKKQLYSITMQKRVNIRKKQVNIRKNRNR